jgi:hypothetical protein
MASKCNKALTADSIESLTRAIIYGNMEYDDVTKALNFDKTLEAGGSGTAISAAAKELIAALSGSAAKDRIEAVAQELVKSCGTVAGAMARTIAVEKVMSELGVSPDDVCKFMRLQKSMYESGASPQDIALVMQSLMESSEEYMDAVAERLKERMAESLDAADVANAMDFVDAFQVT